MVQNEDSNSKVNDEESSSHVNIAIANPFADTNAISSGSSNIAQTRNDTKVAEEEKPSVDTRGFV
jgi:hypothetical protein